MLRNLHFIQEQSIDVLRSLFSHRCHFCGAYRVRDSICASCSTYADTLRSASPTHRMLIHPRSKKRLYVAALTTYEDTFSTWIQSQKMRADTTPNKLLTHFLAEEIKKLYCMLNLNSPIIYCPGKSFQTLHLVEAIVLKLNRLGIEIYPTTALKRNLYLYKKSQKLSSREERTKNLTNKSFLSKNLKPGNYILFDDLCTTGTTLLNLKDTLENHRGVVIESALVLAAVERNKKACLIS